MKGFIELTSLCGNTRLFRADTIIQVVKQAYFTEAEHERLPELKERETWVYINLECTCQNFYVQESYEEVIKLMEEVLQ